MKMVTMYQQADKTWIIVKPQHFEEAQMIFQGTDIKITVENILVQLLGQPCIDLHISTVSYTHLTLPTILLV